MRWRRIVRAVVVTALLAVLAAVAALLLLRQQHRAAYADVGANGVVQSHWINVDGADQVLYARGYDRAAPVLLFLPGGPGESVVPLSGEFDDVLQRHFIVVHVETNGLGRSRALPQPPDFDKLVDITTRMVDFLARRFERRGVYLVGHSFGSALALRVAAARPQQVLGVATVGQTVDWPRGNELAMEHLLALAAAAQEPDTVRALKALPPTLTKASDPDAIAFGAVAQQRQWLLHFGLMNIFEKHTARARWLSYLASPVHSVRESCGLVYSGPCKILGESPRWWDSWHRSLPGIVGFRALRDVPRLEMPYVAIVGDKDWVTPAALVEQYHAALEAPSKRLVRLPEAQHYAHLDDPAGFQAAVLQLLDMQRELSGRY